MYLFDTDILIDYLRLYKPALDFFEMTSAKHRSVAFISQFELLQGCRNAADEKLISTFLKKFHAVPLSPAIAKTAFVTYKTHHLKNGIGIPDSFIAATALVTKLTLLTRNEKHYQKIASLKVERPYS